MKKLLFLLSIGLCACGSNNEKDLNGRWIEILPEGCGYSQGFELKADKSASSIGMSTLKYNSWKIADEKLLLSGESIGNGQTLQFTDTLEIVSLKNDTLVLKKGDRQFSLKREDKADCTTANALQPSRAPFEGFEWGEIKGAGLHLLAQHNDNIRLIADPSLPGIVMVRNGDTQPKMVIRVFDLPNKDINDVITQLSQDKGWDKSQTCRMEEVESNRQGVHRYKMTPDGKYAEQTNKLMQSEPVPATCNGWGMGNSGTRYFEIHESHPNKAIFLEIGQEAPLFDETNITFADTTKENLSEDVLYTMSGTVTLGHEVRSFIPDNSDKEYWIVDKTGNMEKAYDNATGGIKNGQPAQATLKLEYNGKWDDGFAAEYDGVMFVREVVDLKKK